MKVIRFILTISVILYLICWYIFPSIGDKLAGGYNLAVPRGMGHTENVDGVERINIQTYPDGQPFYLDVPKAYINRGVYKGRGQAFVYDMLHLIVLYPGFAAPGRDPSAAYKLALRISYTSYRGTHKNFYMKNYDQLVAAPDERYGHVYGYIYGRGPMLHLLPYSLRASLAQDRWFYLDKDTLTFGTFVCLAGANTPTLYDTCIGSLLINDKYSILLSIPGPMLKEYDQFVDGLRTLLTSMEVKDE